MTTSLADALDTIAESASRHLLITHALDRGLHTRAVNLLELRVLNLFDAYSGDRLLADERHLDDLLGLCLDVPGPLLFRGVQEAVTRRIGSMS